MNDSINIIGPIEARFVCFVCVRNFIVTRDFRDLEECTHRDMY